MRRIDTFPTHEIGELQYCVGQVLPFGATLLDDAVNFSVFSEQASSCSLVLYQQDHPHPFAEIPFTEEFRIGNVYAMLVFGLDWETVEYGYRFDGIWAPSKGLYFDPTRVVLDPYAKSVSGRRIWGQGMEVRDGFVYRGKIISEDYEWKGDTPLNIPAEDLVIYEMHVRSFTKHESSGVRYPGTFAGLVEKIPYLQELGINCVELMPVFEFNELENDRVVDGQELMNYWGYSTVSFFSPKAGYAESGRFGLEADELKNTILKLHQAGIEVLLDVVFNHTAEGDHRGPTISFRGIDNRTYYLLTPEGEYINFSGCGNTMNCNHAVVRNMILDCLRYWVSSFHIDGFRFDLASILTRDEDGTPMLTPPLLETLSRDPVLGRCKLIAEAWDAGGLYQVGNFPSWQRWAEWNGCYRDCLRRFIKGDAGAAPELIQRICGSPDLYKARGPQASINFVTCHDGFTLWDLVSYNEKHNLNNGEDNRDGSNDNASWNCGAEGETDDPEVLRLRLRQMKNMLTILLMSRGIPMVLSGDEFANTQFGNNNAYCQDNIISWLDWDRLDSFSDLHRYLKRMIAFRKEHPVLRSATFYTDYNKTGYPELSFHGLIPWEHDQNSHTLTLGCLYAEEHGKYGTERDAFLYLAINAHWEEHTFRLPIVPEGHPWEVVLASAEEEDSGSAAKLQGDEISVPARSVVVLTA